MTRFWKRGLILGGLVAAALVGLIVAACWPRDYMASRDIGCAQVSSQRGRQICSTISDSMEWTWMGHAIISPGYRLTWDGLRRVYCRENITGADILILQSMKGASDWRLASSADELTHLVNSAEGHGTDSENSIFNPKNPDYILKNGCTAYASR